MYDPAYLAELERRNRRTRMRRIVAIIVLLALIAGLLVPIIVRVVTRPAPPETVIVLQRFPA